MYQVLRSITFNFATTVVFILSYQLDLQRRTKLALMTENFAMKMSDMSKLLRTFWVIYIIDINLHLFFKTYIVVFIVHPGLIWIFYLNISWQHCAYFAKIYAMQIIQSLPLYVFIWKYLIFISNFQRISGKAQAVKGN